MTINPQRIMHLAGRLSAEIVWPHPDLLDPPERWAAHLGGLIFNWPDTREAIGALASAGLLISELRGTPPDLEQVTEHIISRPEPDLPSAVLTGETIGLGFARHVLSDSDTSIETAVDFFVDTIGDDTLTDRERQQMFTAAVGAVITAYTLAWV